MSKMEDTKEYQHKHRDVIKVRLDFNKLNTPSEV